MKRDFRQICVLGRIPVPATDPCLYLKVVSNNCVLLLVCVDDVLVTGSSVDSIVQTKASHKMRYEMTDGDECTFVLATELVDGTDGSVTMCQRRYVDGILKRSDMEECKATASPVDLSSHSSRARV